MGLIMAIQRKKGYSATVAAYLTVGPVNIRIAKLNSQKLTLAEFCELPPRTEAELNVIVDRRKSARTVLLVNGVAHGQREVPYSVLVPF